MKVIDFIGFKKIF